MYETIKKFLADGGKCLLIENGKPIGVVLTIEEYEKLKIEIQNKSEKVEIKEASKSGPDTKFDTKENSIGDAMAQDMEFSEASANIDEINLADSVDVTLEDLGLDELP